MATSPPAGTPPPFATADQLISEAATELAAMPVLVKPSAGSAVAMSPGGRGSSEGRQPLGPPHLSGLPALQTHLLRRPCRSACPRTQSHFLLEGEWTMSNGEQGPHTLCLMLRTTPGGGATILPFRRASMKGRDFSQGALPGTELA